MKDYTIERLLDCMPLCGQWFLHKTQSDDPEKRYYASWEDTVGARKTSVSTYGKTPKQALKKLILQVRGPIAEEDDNE